jgi:hypothetical protein
MGVILETATIGNAFRLDPRAAKAKSEERLRERLQNLADERHRFGDRRPAAFP